MSMTTVVNENPRFEPELGEEYYFINEWNRISKAVNNGHKIDGQRLQHGKVFEDFDSALAARKAIRKALGVKTYLD